MNSIDEIKLLLDKNKQRFGQELKQSKEAISLIKKATHTNLSEEEKEKLKSIIRYLQNDSCVSSIFTARRCIASATFDKINTRYFTISFSRRF